MLYVALNNLIKFPFFHYNNDVYPDDYLFLYKFARLVHMVHMCSKIFAHPDRQDDVAYSHSVYSPPNSHK